MIILSKEQVLMMHRQLITATGGSDGIRDEGMLDSALLNPFQSFGGEELYPSIQAEAFIQSRKENILLYQALSDEFNGISKIIFLKPDRTEDMIVD